MKHPKQVGLKALMTFALTASVGAPSASATRIDPTGTALALTSSNSSLTIHAANSFNCTSSTITGTTPTTSAATLTIPVNLSYSGCTMFGVAGVGVTVPSACTAAGVSAVKLNVTGVTATTATTTVTIPTGCRITIEIPSFTCTLTISGPQTIGPLDVHNATAPIRTTFTLANALVNPITVNPGGGFGCPSAGEHSGTLAGNYTASSGPAPGAIITP